jgi:hypothetical protein
METVMGIAIVTVLEMALARDLKQYLQTLEEEINVEL